MEVETIQNEIASIICIIGDQIIQKNLPVDVIYLDGKEIKADKEKLLKLLSEYDRQVPVNFQVVDTVLKNEIDFARNNKNIKWIYEENGNLSCYFGIILLGQLES